MWRTPNHGKLRVNLLLGSQGDHNAPDWTWQWRREQVGEGFYLLVHPAAALSGLSWRKNSGGCFPPGWNTGPLHNVHLPRSFLTIDRCRSGGRRPQFVLSAQSLLWWTRYESPVWGIWCLDRRSKVKNVTHPLHIKHTDAAWKPARFLLLWYLIIYTPTVAELRV